MKTKAVIFDLDGTLYDNSRLPEWIVLHSLFHLPLLYAERMCRHRMSGRFYGKKGSAYDELFRRMSLLTKCSQQRCSRWYWGTYMPLQVKILKRHCRVKSWVLPTIEKLKAQGIKVACFSEYSFIKEKLNAIGVDPALFDLILDAPTAGGCKPCRKAFMYVAAKLDVHPTEILMVGDREDTDGAGAESCNMRFQLVPRRDVPGFTLDLE